MDRKTINFICFSKTKETMTCLLKIEKIYFKIITKRQMHNKNCWAIEVLMDQKPLKIVQILNTRFLKLTIPQTLKPLSIKVKQTLLMPLRTSWQTLMIISNSTKWKSKPRSIQSPLLPEKMRKSPLKFHLKNSSHLNNKNQMDSFKSNDISC